MINTDEIGIAYPHVAMPGALANAASSRNVDRLADVTAFLALKALAFDDRAENKGAADLVRVMRYAGSLGWVAQQLIDRRKAGQHVAAIDGALDALRRRLGLDPEVQVQNIE